LNLIWTDFAASISVGTKTGFEGQNPADKHSLFRRNNALNVLGTRDVYPMSRVIEYKDIRYAIPAFIAGVLFLLSLVIAFVMICSCTVTWRALNHYMNQTSMGRAVIQEKFPGKAEVGDKTNTWFQKAGSLWLDVPGVTPRTKKRPYLTPLMGTELSRTTYSRVINSG
jgi:hypothetical protein